MVQNSSEQEWSGDLRVLLKGDRVKLQPPGAADEGEFIAEVLENPTDGLWIRVRYISVPFNRADEGKEEQIFVTDVLEKVRPETPI